jgi:hypothetical protein
MTSQSSACSSIQRHCNLDIECGIMKCTNPNPLCILEFWKTNWSVIVTDDDVHITSSLDFWLVPFSPILEPTEHLWRDLSLDGPCCCDERLVWNLFKKCERTNKHHCNLLAKSFSKRKTHTCGAFMSFCIVNNAASWQSALSSAPEHPSVCENIRQHQTPSYKWIMMNVHGRRNTDNSCNFHYIEARLDAHASCPDIKNLLASLLIRRSNVYDAIQAAWPHQSGILHFQS